VEIAEASLAQQDEILRQTDVAFKVGDKSEFEQLQARVSRDNQMPAVLQNRSRRLEAYLRLKQLLNVPLADEVRLTTALDDLRPASPTSRTLDRRPRAGAPGGGRGFRQPESPLRGQGGTVALDLPRFALQPGRLSRRRFPCRPTAISGTTGR